MAGMEEVKLEENAVVVHLAPEHKLIIDLIKEGSRVMDLG